jgi:PDZ domain/Aspartyl protease
MNTPPPDTAAELSSEDTPNLPIFRVLAACVAAVVTVALGLSAAVGAVVLGLSMAGGLERDQTDQEAAAPEQIPTAVAPPATKPKADAAIVVPFKMLPSNHMLVEAQINGKGPYHLIFDLGAPITLLTNKASESSKVVDDDAPHSFLFGMRGEAEVKELQAGGLTVTKLPVIVFDHPTLKMLGEALAQPIDGIMGFTLFARYKVTIDYQLQRMTFAPVDFKQRDLIKDMSNRLMGPKVAKRRVLAPLGLWGLRLGKATGGIESPGVTVTEVEPGSPAAAAGILKGDVITSLDGRWTATVTDVFAAAADAPAGRPATVLFLRQGREMSLQVIPADGA